jgi:hypothetical protein
MQKHHSAQRYLLVQKLVRSIFGAATVLSKPLQGSSRSKTCKGKDLWARGALSKCSRNHQPLLFPPGKGCGGSFCKMVEPHPPQGKHDMLFQRVASQLLCPAAQRHLGTDCRHHYLVIRILEDERTRTPLHGNAPSMRLPLSQCRHLSNGLLSGTRKP